MISTGFTVVFSGFGATVVGLLGLVQAVMASIRAIRTKMIDVVFFINFSSPIFQIQGKFNAEVFRGYLGFVKVL